MLTVFDDLVIVFLSVVLSLAFLWLLQRIWPSRERRVHNDIIGWQIGVLGTTYAVIIGFMLYAVWTTFQEAEINADSEANSLVNVFRLADGLPEAQRNEIHQLAREYVGVVMSDEWPAMYRGELGHAGDPIIQRLWAAAVQVTPTSPSEQTSMSLTLAEISTMTRFRRVRELQSEWRLPKILWILMIVGGCVTIFSACLFGTDDFRLHVALILFLSFLVSLTLVAIADIDRPFQGTVHVLPLGFERARDTFAEASVNAR